MSSDWVRTGRIVVIKRETGLKGTWVRIRRQTSPGWKLAGKNKIRYLFAKRV